MLDPYMVLGVGKYDDDQTVKKAYRKLSKQYHPDNNLNNPNKDAAEETFKKIQQAYEQIMHERSLGIGGPDDLRRKQNEGANAQGSTWNSGYNNNSNNRNSSWGGNQGGNSSTQNASWNNGNSYGRNAGTGYNWGSTANGAGSQGSSQWGSTQTKEKENYNNSDGFWNRTGFTSNSSNTDSNNGSYSNGGYYSGNPNFNNTSYGSNRTSSYYSGSDTSGSYDQNNEDQNGYYGEDTSAFLGRVAENLNKRNFYEAWDILNTMQKRNDVWYYYSAIANLGLGNTITALQHARTAKAMSPNRPEYDELINGIQSGTLHYRGKSEMFVPQKQGSVNTCLRIGIAMVFINIFCGGGGAVCGSMGFCVMC